MEIAEFLLARIAEDKAVARAAVARNGAAWLTYDLGHNGARITGGTEFGNPRSYRGDDSLWDDEGALGMFEETAAHVVRHDPARVLAECEAKRRIVEMALDTVSVSQQAAFSRGEVPSVGGLGEVLQFLAAPYADHPDYQPAWSPLVTSRG